MASEDQNNLTDSEALCFIFASEDCFIFTVTRRELVIYGLREQVSYSLRLLVYFQFRQRDSIFYGLKKADIYHVVCFTQELFLYCPREMVYVVVAKG